MVPIKESEFSNLHIFTFDCQKKRGKKEEAIFPVILEIKYKL